MRTPLLLLVTIFLTYSNLGSAHSPVGFVIPKDGSVIKQAPKKMEIVFTAPAKLIKLEFFRVITGEKSTLIGGLLGSEKLEGIPLDKSHLMKEGKRHLVNIPVLDAGIYKTTWRALSEDGHAIKGTFTFEVSAKGVDVSGTADELLEGEGKIKRVRGSKITIKHAALGDLMPAMTMEFNVSDKKIISNFKRGDKVKFQVNKELELIKIESK